MDNTFVDVQIVKEWPKDAPYMSLGNFINSLIQDRQTINTVVLDNNVATIVTNKREWRIGPTIEILHRGKIKPEIIEQERINYDNEALTTTCSRCETVFKHTKADAEFVYSVGAYTVRCPVCHNHCGEQHPKNK